MKLEAEIRPKVIAVGASGPIGRSSLQVATCARAQKLEPRERQFIDKRGRPAGICLAGALPADLFGYDRMVALAAEALREAGAGLDAPAPMIVALPEPGRPDDDPRFGIDFIRAVAERSGVAVDLERSAVVRAGHAGMALALEAAIGLLRSGPTAVIVGGVDSYFHPKVIAWLDATCRLHALDAENGFVPSEGAAFLVLSRAAGGEQAAQGQGAPKPGNGEGAPLAVLLKVATGREETVTSGEPNTAVTMTDIIASLVEARGGQRLGWVLTDLNGERHRHLEWEKVSFRGSLADPVVHDRLVLDIGDLGAATGAMYAAIVCTWWRIGRASGQTAAIALHSEGPERGAFLLETIGHGSGDEAARPEAVAPPTGDTPARDQAAASRDAVERVLLGLKDFPGRVKREPIVAAVESTIAALSRLEASDIDDAVHLDLLDGAIAKLVSLKDLFAETAEIASMQAAKATRTLQGEEKALRRCRDRTIDVIVARQDRLLRGSPQEKVAYTNRTFRASIGVPSLHTLEESQVAPVVKVAPPEGDYSGEEASPRPELASQGARDEAEDEEPRFVPERPFLERLARNCMEEVAILGRLRDCVGEERFLPDSVGRFEQRLLDNLDALIALAPRGGSPGVDVTAQLLRYVADAPTLDGDRPFARALVLGSIDGDDAIRAGILALRQAHPVTRAAQREALALAPSPAIAAAMKRLCADSEPTLTILALDVLRLRREATFAAVLPSVTHPEIAVRASAARCLGVVPERAAAVEILGRVLDTEEEDRVAAAAAQSLLLHGARRGLTFARERLTLEIEEAGSIAPDSRIVLLRLLGLAGGESDRELMLQSLGSLPEDAEALGWFGHPGHIEPLLEALERRGDRMGTSALSRFETEVSRALHRITGATPGVSSEDTAADLDLDDGVAGPERWRAWWEEHRGVFVGSQQKHRFGRPFSPLSTIEELGQRDVPMRTREIGELEISILTAGASRFDAHDWVARQAAELDAVRMLFTPAKDPNKDPTKPEDRGYPPGEWPAMRLWRGATPD